MTCCCVPPSVQGVAGLRYNPQFRHLTLAELVDITDDGLQVCVFVGDGPRLTVE